jgi:phage terminase large subunit-like protein
VRSDAPSLVALLPAFGLNGSSWASWSVVAKALDGQGTMFTAEEQALFEQCTGRTRVPTERPREFVGIMGRRSGKSRFAGAVAARAAGFGRYALAPGERAVVGLAASDREQARVLLEYAVAPFEPVEDRRAAGPQLADLVTRRTRWGLDLATGTSLEVRTASFGRIRGRTYACVIADEVAYWARDDGANPASEVLTAVRPGLVTLDGPLVVITTPYAKTGPPYDAFVRYFARTTTVCSCGRSRVA